MRQILVIVPRGQGQRALAMARDADGRNLVCVAGHGPDGERDLVVAHVPNAGVERLMAELQHIVPLEITLLPQGVITLYPPAGRAPEQVTDVTLRSPFEIFFGGLQSIGSWRGFLGYAAAAGAVVWIGMHTNTVYLLVAAMLIAPFAGPAMTLALGTARGDHVVIGRSVLRYFASLAVTIATAFGLSLVVRQEISTGLMIATSQISSVSVLLPLVAGAAGAVNLAQSERNSLVTAAGPGILIAASLAPPAGLIGMGAAMADWDLVRSGGFVLLLQLVGINLAGSLTFWAFGLTPSGVRYDRGQSRFRSVSLALTAVAAVALLVWQFASQPDLQRSTLAQRAATEVQRIVNDSDIVDPVEVNVRFTRADIGGQDTLLVIVYTQRSAEADAAAADIEDDLADRIGSVLTSQFDVTPVVHVVVLEASS